MFGYPISPMAENRDKIDVVARPKEVYEVNMDKGLVCRTDAEDAGFPLPAPPPLANPIRVVPKSIQGAVRTRWQGAIDRGFALSPRNVCEIFGVSRGAVHNALNTGELPGFRLGNLWRIRPEAIPPRLVEYWIHVTGRYEPPPPPELPVGELVYFIGGAPGYVKIGYTTDLARRIKALQIGCPKPIELLAHARGGRSLEYDYHRRFSAWRQTGEWFRLSQEVWAEINRLNAKGATDA